MSACKLRVGTDDPRLTFLESAILPYSSSCLHPLNRASITRVEVTSFSLKKRLTTPCGTQAGQGLTSWAETP